VAEVAAFLADRIQRNGTAIDRQLIETAALLHDVGKVTDNDSGAAGDHALMGAQWLREQGYAELGPAVASHPATLLGDDARYAAWVEDARLEERVVAYADKRATQDVVSLDQRFDEWEAHHPEHLASLRASRERARRLELEVCTVAGIEPRQVERLAWVEAVMPARVE
jgi:putative nucleotidyltransferase with HDIG domain